MYVDLNIVCRNHVFNASTCVGAVLDITGLYYSNCELKDLCVYLFFNLK